MGNSNLKTTGLDDIKVSADENILLNSSELFFGEKGLDLNYAVSSSQNSYSIYQKTRCSIAKL